MRDAGIDGPRFTLVEEDFNKEVVKDFEYPLIIKPVDLSSSRGVMKINSEVELEEAIEYASRRV